MKPSIIPRNGAGRGRESAYSKRDILAILIIMHMRRIGFDKRDFMRIVSEYLRNETNQLGEYLVAVIEGDKTSFIDNVAGGVQPYKKGASQMGFNLVLFTQKLEEAIDTK